MVSEQIAAIYENYLEQVRKADLKDARRLGGVLRIVIGQKSGEELPSDFDDSVKVEISLLQQNCSSSEILELAEWMLEQAKVHQDKPRIKYAFMAVQRHLVPLIQSLCPADAAILAEKFGTAYPRRERFPAHDELIKKLQKQARV